MGGAGDAVPVRGDSETVVRLLDWFERERRDLPWRRTRDPYGIWVSEVMLQQTQVGTVIPYWERWMRELPDLASLAAADEARVLKLWEGLGYYRRARHLQAAARVIRDQHGGVFPRNEDDLLALPGVGRYTVGAIRSIAFGEPAPIVDGNVIRVLTRWHAEEGDPRDKSVNAWLWKRAGELVSQAAATARPDACSHLNQALMEIGATVCTPRAPACERCPLADRCRGRRSGAPEKYPRLAARPTTTARRFVVIVAEADGKFLVRQRGASEVNGGLWEFPNEECGDAVVEAQAVARRWLGDTFWPREGACPIERWGEVRHAITRYRIRQEVFRVRSTKPAPVRRRGDGAVWKRLAELRELPFGSAHRRILGWLIDAI